MRASEIQEQTLERLEQKRTHVASMRASEIQEQTLERLEQNRMRIMSMRASETQKQTLERLEQNRMRIKEIELAGLQLKHVYARVSVNLRVQKLADLETVRTGKQKQHVYVADHSSTAKVTLWEEQVGILHDQTSYKLENIVVREFGGTKYLSMGSE